MFFFKNKWKESGFTLFEFAIVAAILGVIFAISYVTLKPSESRQKARDSKRLQDLQTLQRAIIEYSQDTGTLPDSINTLRKSNTLPIGITDLQLSSGGWVNQNLSGYLVFYPVDPINDETFYYSYMRNDVSFEINARLESLTEFAEGDGGNDSSVYEVGTNLLLIEP